VAAKGLRAHHAGILPVTNFATVANFSGACGTAHSCVDGRTL